ncbi:hypothetical protein INT44_004286 [Umbelopsis vinacea]|uniref:peptidylprolyl isomerase n=1 Tax=Umbelopsis vinacea TaxID=44442 RepID=A0A8H7USD2_9FUNG|nr:hypothetical protein INT44_004286 [Umbelopsis vinacea]
MDLKAKLEKGIELKSAGNKAFSSNNIKGGMALHVFLGSKVSIHVTISVCSSYELPPGTDNIQEAMGSQTIKEDPVKLEIKQQTAACYSNLAACLIKDEKWPKVIDYCKKALALEPQNKKANFRIAQAYLRTGKIDLAQEKLQELAKSDPADAAVKRELALLKQKDKIATVKEKKIYKNMFERMSKEPEN